MWVVTALRSQHWKITALEDEKVPSDRNFEDVSNQPDICRNQGCLTTHVQKLF